MLAASQSAFANIANTSSYPETNIETIVVTATPEVANFEIYSDKHSQQAIKQVMNYVTSDLNSDSVEKARISSATNSSI